MRHIKQARTCEMCGTSYLSAQTGQAEKKQRYCSAACRLAAASIAYRSTREPRTCEACHCSFRPTHRGRKGDAQRYCSRACLEARATPLLSRFFSHIVNSDDEFACWEWTVPIDINGYGHLFLVPGVTGRTQAHRVAYFLFNGPIPAGLLVCHRCDNRRCVNPRHLFLGTHQDNTDDMIAKGRAAPPTRGERSGSALLTEEQVRAIRQERTDTGDTYATIGKRFGVHPVTVGKIVRRITWSHV